MRRIFTLLLFASFSLTATAQPLLVENFDFEGNLTSNGWEAHSSGGTTPIGTTSGLTYAGYAGSGIGNAANMTGTGEDDHKTFPLQNANGATIYMSALVNVNDPNAFSGMYFLHLGNRTSTAASFTNFTARVYVKTNATTGVNFGLSINETDANGTYAPGTYLKGSTYLLIVKYVINTGGNDMASLWIKDSGVPGSEAAAGAPDVTITDQAQPGTAATEGVNAVALRQNASLPDLVIDGIRIASNWWDAPLPLNLTSFKGSLANNEVQLNWTSLNEQNSQRFIVERSTDGRTYAEIGQLAAGNRNQASYSFSDKTPSNGTNYYRLKMTDKDGLVRYSTIVIIANREGLKAQVFPNPTFGNLSVSHSKAVKGATIRILNAEGKQIKTHTVNAGAIQTSLTVGELVKGNYILVFENDGEKATSKFVKQ